MCVLLCGPRADLWPFYIETHKTAINQPVDHTEET